MPPAEPVDTAEIRELLAEDARLRRLARRLVADPATADDLVQEAWLAALRRPGAARSPGRWLAGALRKARLARARGELRRRAREAAAARAERVPGADEVAAALDLRVQVVRTLAALDEPYRAAVYLRFFRDAPLRAIAAAQGVSTSTADERVREGLARMRRALDRAHGGRRREWALALLSLEPPRAAAALTIGGLAMGTTAKAALAAAVLAAAAGAWLATRDSAPPARPAAPEAAGGAPPRAPRAAVASAARPDERRALAALPVAAPAAAAAPAARVAGLLVDAEGRPLAGVRLVAPGLDAPVETDPRGRFELARPGDGAPALEIEEGAPLAIVARDERAGELLLVAVRLHRFAGVVVDADDRPIAGAELTVRLSETLYRDRGILHDRGSPVWRTTSSADGRFTLPRAPGGAHAFLLATRDGYAERRLDLRDGDDAALVVELDTLEGGYTLRGVVLGPDGRPFAGARVSAGDEIVTSAADGAFAVAWDPHRRRHAMHALGPDGVYRPRDVQTHLAAVAEDLAPARVELSPEMATRPIELRLAARGLSIEGRVVDAAGAPVAGAVVWLLDPTHLGQEVVREGAVEMRVDASLEDGDRDGGGVTCDEEGRFRLAGLLDRAYRVAAYDPRTASFGEEWSLPAGTHGARLVLAPDPSCRRVAGRVVTTAGAPLPGAEVSAARTGPSRTGPPFGAPRRVTTDEDGRFDLGAIAVRGTILTIAPPASADAASFRFALEAARADLDHEPDLERVEIVVRRRCELQVELADPAAADSLLLLDPEGAALDVYELLGSFAAVAPSARFESGRTSVLLADETAAVLVLRKGDEEVRRVPIALDPDERTIVRL